MPLNLVKTYILFPISRDPPEGGTNPSGTLFAFWLRSFQFLGIPPKGEQKAFKGLWVFWFRK